MIKAYLSDNITKMKEKISIISVLVGIFIGAVGSYFFATQITTQRPKNCNDFAVAYIDMAREDYKIDANSPKWSEVIDTETQMHQMCEAQLGLYPEGEER